MQMFSLKIKMPSHIKTRMDKAEFKARALERVVSQLKSVGASKAAVAKAKSAYDRAYVTFANIATRACEQGLL